MPRPARPAANDAHAAGNPTRDLFAALDAEPSVPAPAASSHDTPATAPPVQRAADGAAEPEDAAAPEPRIRYAEAQRLMAIGRAQGPDALTQEQHNAIWDCLLELPESQAWLASQLNALQSELQERGLRPA